MFVKQAFIPVLLLLALTAHATVVNIDMTFSGAVERGPVGNNLPGVIGDQESAIWNAYTELDNQTVKADLIDEDGKPTSLSFICNSEGMTLNNKVAYASAGSATGFFHSYHFLNGGGKPGDFAASSMLIGGLTPGAEYDVALYATWHWIDAGTAFIIDGVKKIATGVPSEATANFVEGQSYVLFIAVKANDSGELLIEFETYAPEAGGNRGPVNAIQIQDSQGPIYVATSPTPEEGVMVKGPAATLSWKAGYAATAHNVYLGVQGEELQLVAENHTETSLTVTDLVPGATYAWRVDEINPAEADSPWAGPEWSFRVQPIKAYAPKPADDIVAIGLNPTLTWSPGADTLLHYVAFGTDADEVANSTPMIPQTLDPANYTPAGPLEYNTTYYWRVDEFSGAHGRVKGDVWSFTTVPMITIEDESLLAHWTFDLANAGSAVDVSGHNLHGAISGNPVWVDGVMGGAVALDGSSHFVTPAIEDVNTAELTITAWINPLKVQSGVKGLVFSRGQGTTTGLNLRASNQLAYHWMAMPESYQFDQGPIVTAGEWNFVALVGQPDKARLYLNSTELYAENVISHAAFVPNAGFNVGRDTQSGRNFKGSMDDVRVYTRALSTEELQALINAASVPSVVDPLAIENFDGYRAYYADADPNIWDVWADGYGGNGTGSTAGYEQEPFVERVIIQGDTGQALPMAFNNLSLGVSEISREFSPAQDLTREGAQSLVLYVRGNKDNIVSEDDQVTLVLSDGTTTDTIVIGDSVGLAGKTWQRVLIDLSTLTIDATKLSRLAIQVGAPGNVANGSVGTLYVDNIGLMQ